MAAASAGHIILELVIPGSREARPAMTGWRDDDVCACAPSGQLQHEVRLEPGLPGAPHHRAQEHCFEFAAVIGEVAVGLAEYRNDLGHFETEHAVLVRERGAMTLRLVL